MLSRKIIPLLCASIVLAGRMPAQVYAPAASYSFDTDYDPPGDTDKVFIFNRPEYQTEITASIMAVSFDSLPDWSFQWSVFDPVTMNYKLVTTIGSGWYSEIDTISVSSGYQVVMTKGSDTDTFRIWLLINDLDLEITNKDEEDKLLFGYYNCSSLDLRADTTKIPLFYYNPETAAKLNVDNHYGIRWTTDNEEATSPSRALITRVTKPPSQDTWYILTLTDDFGLERSDSVFYESIQSKADIITEYINLGDSLEYPEGGYDRFYDDDIKSAPGKYRFDISGSRNMASYEIEFGDGNVFISEGDTLNVVHEYQKPGIYKVVLTTKSDKPYECLDSLSVEAELVYAAADNFALPNVFTPNDDGNNDRIAAFNDNNFFRSADVSVLTIDITIFDRAGHKVHSYAGSIRDWEGWNGLIRNSNNRAPEGVYFYVISMFAAYEDKNKPIGSKVMSGYFHLYRE